MWLLLFLLSAIGAGGSAAGYRRGITAVDIYSRGVNTAVNRLLRG